MIDALRPRPGDRVDDPSSVLARLSSRLPVRRLSNRAAGEAFTPSGGHDGFRRSRALQGYEVPIGWSVTRGAGDDGYRSAFAAAHLLYRRREWRTIPDD